MTEFDERDIELMERCDLERELIRIHRATLAKPLNDYSEELGPVVWWKFPVTEPAWIGTPDDSDWPGYHTHFTPHPEVHYFLAEEADDEQ